MSILRQSLLDTYLIRLRVMASFWEIELTTTRQREAALELAQAMEDPKAVERASAALPDDQRQALRDLLASDGQMPQRVFARKWGEIRTMGPGRMEREQPWQEPDSAAEALWYRGFLFRRFEPGPEGAYEVVFVPPELRQSLPVPKPEISGIALEPTSRPSTVYSMDDSFLDDACTLLAYVQNQRPRLDSDHLWRRTDKERLLHRFRNQDAERLAFLSHLAFRIGWIREDESGRLRLTPEAVTTWLKSSSFCQRSALAETWRDDSAWNDLFHVPSLQPVDTGIWRNDPVLARNAIFRHLEACDPETWYRLDDLVTAIKAVDPDFQRPDGDYEAWYIRDEETGAYLSGFESWDEVEGRLIRYLMKKPMAWLGLIDLGADRPDGPPVTFRLAKGAAALLGLSEYRSAPEPPALRLCSGFRLSVPAARRYERFQLARIAAWTRSGHQFTYRLTPASLERARQQQISVTRVLDFLEETTQAPVPSPVETALTRWEARGTEAQLENPILLRLSSEELMAQITSSPRLRHLVQEQIGPTTALVRRQDWERVVAGLEDVGLLPDLADLPRS